MIVLGVVPSKVPSEISEGLVIIQERAGILWGSFYGAKGRLDKRIGATGDRQIIDERSCVRRAGLIKQGPEARGL